ncbi:uncharacterized protein ACRADG_002295 [Cochliomyia hominivorax]
MPKNRLILNTKKSEQPPDSENDNLAKTRASRYARFVRTSKFLPKIEMDNFHIRKALNIYMREELEQLGRKTYFQRIFILTQNCDMERLMELNLNSSLINMEQPDYLSYLQYHLDLIFTVCEKKKSSTDHLSGLSVVMDVTHTFLMLEGPEDMMAIFFEELSKIHDQLWLKSKVFMVEDKIGETYFDSFYSRRSSAININEKFPPSTYQEFNLMASQHLKVKEKLMSLIETLTDQLKKSASESCEMPKQIPSDPFLLPNDPYNKYLPEIQRIDIIMNANKFYYNIKDFSLTYQIIPTYQDEDALLWPIQHNYTPLDIFERSTFDVNLTFGNYGKDEPQEEEGDKKQENGSHDINAEEPEE